MKFHWIASNLIIYKSLSVNDRINLKNHCGCSLITLMWQHPDVLLNRIKRYKLSY